MVRPHTHRDKDGHIKELMKPDPSVREQDRRRSTTPGATHDPATTDTEAGLESLAPVPETSSSPGVTTTEVPRSNRIATVVDEEQLHQRLVESKSFSSRQLSTKVAQTAPKSEHLTSNHSTKRSTRQDTSPQRSVKTSTPLEPDQPAQPVSRSKSSSGSSDQVADAHIPDRSASTSSAIGLHRSSERPGSPPPVAIIIPPRVARNISARSRSTTESALTDPSLSKSVSGLGPVQASKITRDQLEYGPFLQHDEVQVLYRSPEVESVALDSHIKDEQAKLVAPNRRQSPIALMSVNPAYQSSRKPLQIEYPSIVDNARLNNIGFSWEVKIPYQISMMTSVLGAQLGQNQRFRLDQFHCHWGSSDGFGSEHTVDGHHHSAELHFVHYNMDKYHSLSKAARHPDGLLVIAVFLDASEPDHRNHAELDKVTSQLKWVKLKGEHAIIKQGLRIENLLPQNRSYWSYQGSLTTPPYFESVTWFVFKQPIKCSREQIKKFRDIKSSLRDTNEPDQDENEDETQDDSQNQTGNTMNQEAGSSQPVVITGRGSIIKSNHRKTQPLNGRTVLVYDE